MRRFFGLVSFTTGCSLRSRDEAQVCCDRSGLSKKESEDRSSESMCRSSSRSGSWWPPMLIHVIDESLLGGSFVEKVREHWWPQTPGTNFSGLNTAYFAVMIASVVLYDSVRRVRG